METDSVLISAEKPIKIGLTGGIGSGKSTIAAVFAHLGYPVYISDKEASRLMNQDAIIRQEIIKEWGTKMYNSAGELDKPALAKLIFENKEALRSVNRIVHPRVMADFCQWSERQKKRFVVFESAILFEAGLENNFDYIICITVPEVERIQRVIKRDDTTPEKVRERIRNQMDDIEKCGKADFVIGNGNKEMVVEQVLEVIKNVENMQNVED